MTKADRRQQPDWYGQLKQSPYSEGGMSETMRRNVTGRLQGVYGNRRRRKRFVWTAVCSIAGMLLIGALGWTINGSYMDGTNSRIEHGGEYVAVVDGSGSNGGEGRETRSVYMENNVKLLEVIPGGDYAAGSPAGCWWNLYTPFDQMKERIIRIEAVHRESGYRLTELAETKISAIGSEYAYGFTSPNEPAKGEMTRIATRFSLPLPGSWSFVVYLDGQRYADVVFDVPDSAWTVSTMFKSGSYNLRGTKGQLGFIDVGFKAGKGNKYMWHFWGRPEELQGALKIEAVRRGSNRIESVFAAERLGGALNGADAAIPSMMMLPEPGTWRLLAFIGDKLHGSVVVEVK